MKTFAVAYMNYFDNVLTITFEKAESAREAMMNKLAVNGWDISDFSDSEIVTEDGVKQFAFDGDCMVEAQELPSVV